VKKRWGHGLLFCAKTIVRESHNFELASLKKEEDSTFGSLMTHWLSSFTMLFETTTLIVILTIFFVI